MLLARATFPCILLTMLACRNNFSAALLFGKRSASTAAISSKGTILSKKPNARTSQKVDASPNRTNDEKKKVFIPKGFVTTPFQYQEEIILDIVDLSNLGMGIGRYTLPCGGQWVVMVPLVLPGEKVKVKIYKNHSSYSEADLVNVIFSSPDRVVAPCEHFSVCGGCQYQHMNIEAQRQWKRSQVVTLLQRIGGITDVNVNGTIGSTHLYSYRTKITPHYATPHSLEDLRIGFHKRGTKTVIDIKECMIATKDINDAYLVGREKIAQMVSVKLPKKGATLLYRDHDGGVETDSRKIITQKVGNVVFKFKAGEFFQNNAHVLPVLVNHVISQALGFGCSHLIDTYCGSGLFALSAARYFKTVYGVEVSELAVAAAIANAEYNKIQNVEFICGVSERIFSKVEHFPRDETVVIIDPPRKGCDGPFLQQLFSFSPKVLVYVSCDPATQARDAKDIVAAGYKVTSITPFDLFPQTRHVENVMTFVRTQ